MKKIKVLLANKPRILRESLKDLIQGQPDMEVVAEVFDPVELLLKVGETHADVVLVELPDAAKDPGICSHLLAEYPEVLILAVSSGSGRAFLYRQTLSRQPIEQISSMGVLSAIRRA